MVEIVFSNKKEKKDVVKVGIVFSKTDKKYLSDIEEKLRTKKPQDVIYKKHDVQKILKGILQEVEVPTEDLQ